MRIKQSVVWVGVSAVVAVLGWALWTVKSHGFSAREKPAAYEIFLARQARRLASEPGATGLKNPVEATLLAVAEARDHFADHCATCHGNRGDGKTQINAGLYPPAPDMRESATQELSDGELFYLIKNGVRFTGMPGWGGSDEDNWKLVLFIRHLPKLTDKEVEFMREVNQMPVEAEQGH
ncbi:MAG: c-type cytochrome [Acidobacteriota bacterium]